MNKQLLLIGAAITCSSCVSPPAQEEKKMETHLSTDTVNLDFTVTEAAEWTALFDRTSGWFGADGIFALPLSGVDQAGGSDSTMLIFSDTMVGEIKDGQLGKWTRSEEHTSELQSLMRISYAVFCLKKKNSTTPMTTSKNRSK